MDNNKRRSKNLFKKLKKLTPQKRMETVNSSASGRSMLELLTPTQYAELFPKYYQRGLPDVGGFREAITRKAAEKQSAWQKSVDEQMAASGGSTAATGNLAANQKEAYKAAIANGLSPSAAKILVANMSGESLKNPADHHWDRSHMSQGIVQWDPTRAERIKNQFGSYPKDMSVADQTKAAIWEMKTYYPKSYQALTDDNLSTQERLQTVVSDYERPADVSGAVSNRMSFFRGLSLDEGNTKPSKETTSGSTYNVNQSGYVVPKDNNLYSQGNTEQCATLSKAFNPEIGRSSTWQVVPGDIKPGMTVATMQYNRSGGDRTGSGYHTGIAMSAPDSSGKFLLLEQYTGSNGAKLRWVNQNSYDTGKEGGTTQFGLIQSNGKLHNEVSQEAINYGNSMGAGSMTAPAGGEGVTGSVEVNPNAPGPGASNGAPSDQSATVMSPMQMMADMIPGGGMISNIMQTAIPLVGALAGMMHQGEGVGDAGPVHKTKNYADPKDDYNRLQSISREAKTLGVDPHHLATAMLYESIGSLNPDRKGVVDKRRGSKQAVAQGAQNRFMGLIQFGAREQLKYGVKPGMSFDDQMKSVSSYLKDKGLVKWMQNNPNATEKERRTALYSTINAGGPEKKHWGKTDKRYGGSSTTVAQKTENMFRDWGPRAQKLMAAQDPSTQFAQASPIPKQAAGLTTPGGPTTPTPTQMAQNVEPSKMDKLKRGVASIMGIPQASAQSEQKVLPKTPGSMDVSAQPAPTTKISKQARNPFGMYSTPSSKDINYQFGKGKRLSADVMPRTQADVQAEVGFSSGDITPQQKVDTNIIDTSPNQNMQFNMLREEMMNGFNNVNQQVKPMAPETPEISNQGMIPDLLPLSKDPYKTPSMERAAARSAGFSDTGGFPGWGHFDLGNKI